jgi:hypothetical protein
VLQDPGITITRGKSDVQDKTPPSTATWTWEDPNGVYNNENPRSPYFGILPRNTPVRCYVPRATSALLMVDGANGIRCSTADKAALAIVGDIDVRIDIEPTRWRGFGSRNSHNMLLASRRGRLGQRSLGLLPPRRREPLLSSGPPTGVQLRHRRCHRFRSV